MIFQDDKIEGIIPFQDDIGADFTIRLPSNNEAFLKNAHVASTPAPWSNSIVPQVNLDGDDYTMAFIKFPRY